MAGVITHDGTEIVLDHGGKQFAAHLLVRLADGGSTGALLTDDELDTLHDAVDEARRRRDDRATLLAVLDADTATLSERDAAAIEAAREAYGGEHDIDAAVAAARDVIRQRVEAAWERVTLHFTADVSNDDIGAVWNAIVLDHPAAEIVDHTPRRLAVVLPRGAAIRAAWWTVGGGWLPIDRVVRA